MRPRQSRSIVWTLRQTANVPSWDHASAVVLEGAVIAPAMPLVLQSPGHLVNVMNFVDRHTLIGKVQHLFVHVGIKITLGAQHFLNACVAPPRPMVRGKHNLRFMAESVDRLGDRSIGRDQTRGPDRSWKSLHISLSCCSKPPVAAVTGEYCQTRPAFPRTRTAPYPKRRGQHRH
jgi:hypothetical protein